jgi:N,N'-diacetylchitobiose transport system substrate-binding protein
MKGIVMKKLLIWLLVIIFVVSMVFVGAGCKKINTIETTAAETTAAETTAAETTAAETTAAKPSGQIIISTEETYPAEVEIMNTIFAEFEKETGIKVIVQTVAWADAITKYTAAFSSGEVPDLVQTNGSWDTGWYESKWIRAVDDVIAMIGKDKFVPGALEATKWRGKYIGVPFTGGAWMMFYRADWFKEAGLEPPSNSENLLKAAKYFTKNGKWGIALPGALADAQQAADTFCQGFGGYVTNDKNEVTVNSPENVKAIQMYVDLFKNNFVPPGSLNLGWGDVGTAFANEQVAMFPLNGWGLVIANSTNPNSVKPGIVGITEFKENPDSPPAIYNGNWVIPTKAKNPEGAALFCEFFLRTENLSRFLASVPFYPMMPVTLEVAKTAKEILEDPLVKTQVDLFTRGYVPWFKSGDSLTGTFYNTDFTFAQAIQDVLTKSMTVQQALDLGKEKILKARKDAGYTGDNLEILPPEK